jgi:hypothetical protein
MRQVQPAASSRKAREKTVDLIHHERVEPAEARRRASDAAALWSVGYLGAAELVAAACDLLVAGHESPALAMLAGVHARHADDEVPDLAEAALPEVGLEFHLPGSSAGAEAAVRALARRVLDGLMEPRALTAWAHSAFGHDGLELAERLAELDDTYDCLDVVDLTEHDVDADVTAEARRLVGSTSRTPTRSPI